MRSHLLTVAAVVVPLTAAPLITVPVSASVRDEPSSTAAPLTDLVDRVSGAGAKKHLEEFQAIANRSGGNRAAGTPGYEASADYVAKRMRQAGYRVTVQQFTYSFFREKAKPQLRAGSASYLASTVQFSAAGTAHGKAVRIKNHGCHSSDYKRLKPGAIALVQRGTCTFGTKASQAEAAGATAVIIVNDKASLPEATLGGPGVSRLPVVGVAKNTGSRLAGKRVRVTVRATTGVRVTSNVLAETPGGREDRVVMLGAHLDSVEEGPGINDNGSGAAALLEIATKLGAQTWGNKVRFAWWGAEELGLLGSRHYITHLSVAERRKIGAYLNFDMIASPNHVYGIYDGDDSDGVGAGPGPTGSAQIEKDFQAFYASRGLSYTGVDFDGRSDYGPFIQVGIPSGGLFTGAEGLKTRDHAERFGGTAGKPFDPCYHKACDTVENINEEALDVNTDAIAYVLSRYIEKLPNEA